jgi:hypothetical protein
MIGGGVVEETEALDAPPAPCPIQEGTVGWPGSREIVELGKEAEDGPRVALVRVTLFEGHPPGEPMTADGFANGRTILARLGGLVRHVPKRGTRVVVVFPGSGALGRPAFEAPGAAVILTVIGEDPPRFFGRAKTVLDFGDDEVVIRARSIALVCEAKREDGSVARHVVSVSGEGGAQVVSDGSGLFVKDGEVALQSLEEDGAVKSAITLNRKELGVAVLEGGLATITIREGDVSVVNEGNVALAYGGAIGFGMNASPATPVLLGLSGQAGAPSTSMFGSP